jgi:hypothetical protein
MKTRGTWLVPTLATMAEMIEPRNDVALQIRGRHMVPRLRETTRPAISLGLKIAAGTDTDYGPTSNFRLVNEMLELAQAWNVASWTPFAPEPPGQPTASESIAAPAGCRPGLEADLIVVELNPLTLTRKHPRCSDGSSTMAGSHFRRF